MTEQEERSKARGAMLSVMLGLMAGAMILVFLIMLTGGLFFYVVVFAVGMLGFAGVHYVLWGHMLTYLLRDEIEREHEADQAREAQQAQPTPASTHIRQR
jgi:threonine/homoserine/homoserine lactone efflux protein